jgi:putative protease
MDAESVRKNLSKLGDTPFSLERFEADLGDNVMLPVSKLNALRRDAISELTNIMTSSDRNVVPLPEKIGFSRSDSLPKIRNVGRFHKNEQITAGAKDFFDVILLPLSEFAKYPDKADGFIMPPVVFDTEKERILELLKESSLAKYAVITNLGQIEAVKNLAPEAKLIADFRFNIGNSETVAFFENLGFDSCVLSAELTLPQIRDISGPKAAIVYGRIPLMTLEKCVIKEIYGDRESCGKGKACAICDKNAAEMKDRRGFVFPVIRKFPHRNIVLNSLPTQMSDRQDDLSSAGISDRHFLFTTESATETDKIIEEHKKNLSPRGKVRRI